MGTPPSPRGQNGALTCVYACAGKVKPIVGSVYPFEDALKAYERLMTGRATGKVVIKVDPEIADS